MSKDN